MEAPQTARTVRDNGETQYAWRASPMTSTRLGIRLLPGPPLFHLGLERRQLVFRDRGRVFEEIRYGSAAKRANDSIDHRRHRLPVGPSFLEPVIDLLLALPTQRNEVLVDEAVERRRHARVRDVSVLPDLLVDRSRCRRAEVPHGAKDRQLELAEFHTNT